MTYEEKIQDFYLASLEDILEGVDIKELEYILKDFEDEEMYEECAGVKKALDFIKKRTIKEIKVEYKEMTYEQNKRTIKY